MIRNLPHGFECPVKTCRHHDPVGSENSCSNGGSLMSCPIAQGFMTDLDREHIEAGRIVVNDSENLHATRAYLIGKRRGECAEQISGVSS